MSPNIPSLDPRRLETFRVVAETGQVSGAARALRLSQPAVTAQIRRLEEEIGHPLFTRHASGVQMTAAGRTLFEYARRIHSTLEEAGERLLGASQTGGVLRIAASTTVAAYVLPSVLRRFLEQHRPSSVDLKVGNTDEVLTWVRNGQAPLGLVEGLTRARGLSLEPYLKDELVPVRAVDAPRALAAVKKATDLTGVPLIWREPGSGTRAVVERALRKLRPALAPRAFDLTVGDTESIKSCVLLGLGIGFLSRWSIDREVSHGLLDVIRLPDLTIPRTFSWARIGGGVSGQAQLFQRFAVGFPPKCCA
jgi:DNA-binding transcriptional LysR family regulator